MSMTQPFVERTGHVRWVICAMLFAVIALSYVDRQVLSVLKPTLQHMYGWSEVGYGDLAIWFQAAYGLGYVVFGRVVDSFGAKTGGAIAVSVRTIAHIAHALGRTNGQKTWARIPIGLGESGAIPDALPATTDWIPKTARALAS